jgi:hypothetical protein
MFTAATNGGARGAGSPVTFARHCMGRHARDVRLFGYLAARHQHRIQSTQNRDGAAIHAKLERGARGYPCVNANFDSDLS